MTCARLTSLVLGVSFVCTLCACQLQSQIASVPSCAPMFQKTIFHLDVDHARALNAAWVRQEEVVIYMIPCAYHNLLLCMIVQACSAGLSTCLYMPHREHSCLKMQCSHECHGNSSAADAQGSHVAADEHVLQMTDEVQATAKARGKPGKKKAKRPKKDASTQTPPPPASKQLEMEASKIWAKPRQQIAEQEYFKFQAVTMHGMIRNVEMENRKCYRILHADAMQASIITDNGESIHRMADDFCKYPPKMVLCLLTSLVDMAVVQSIGPLAADKPPMEDMAPMEEAICLLERFMQKVLLPVAEEANALVLCDARSCILTASFMKAYNLRKPAWGAEAPLTIIGFANSQHMSRESPSFWRSLLAKLYDCDEENYTSACHAASTAQDLRDDIPNLVLIDGIGQPCVSSLN